MASSSRLIVCSEGIGIAAGDSLISSSDSALWVGSRFAQIRQLLPGRDKGFLRQILTLAETAGGAVRQGTKQRLIAGYNAAKRIPVTCQTQGDQLGIAEIRVFRCLSHRRFNEVVWKKVREVTKKRSLKCWLVGLIVLNNLGNVPFFDFHLGKICVSFRSQPQKKGMTL